MSVLVCLFLAHQAQAATRSASSCSDAAVQAAVNSAANGDIVAIPAGNCTWTDTVTIPSTKGLTITGAGAGKTVLSDKTSGGLFVLNLSASTFSRLTGFTADNASPAITVDGSSISGTAYNSFRIDHLVLDHIPGGRGITVLYQGRFGSGVIDHVTFNCTVDGATCQSVQIVGGDPQQSSHMGRPFDPGSNKYTYVEDCTANYVSPQDGFVEGYGGAWWVVRNNHIHGPGQGSHGADSGNYRGTQAVEMYRNQQDQVGSSTPQPHAVILRSGVGFIWGNSWSNDYNNHVWLDNYRSRGSYGVWGSCNTAYDSSAGRHGWDGNSGGGSTSAGWPCLDEVGHMFTASTSSGSNSAVGLYVFENNYNDVSIQGGGNVEKDIVANREYWTYTSGFNGSGGVGQGPVSARPKSCTVGTGYWATDEGEWDSTHSGPDGRFYKCTSANNWTLYYTPYTYPHPLTQGGGQIDVPGAPSNLRIIR